MPESSSAASVVDNSRAVVIVTVDLDGPTALQQEAIVGPYRGPAFESYGEFGLERGLDRLLDMLDVNSIPATFFVPGWVAENRSSAIKKVIRAGHELGAHGYLHEYARNFDSAETERDVIERSTAAIVEITGTMPLGYRPPGYETTEQTVEFLAEIGYTYSSMMSDSDQIYVRDVKGKKLAEVPVFWHLADDLFGAHIRTQLPPSAVMEHWQMELDNLPGSGSVCVLTLHAHTVGHPGRIRAVSDLLRTYALNNDAYEFMSAGTAASRALNGNG